MTVQTGLMSRNIHLIMLVWNKDIRQHPVDPSALGIVTSVPRDPEPFMTSVLESYDTITVVPENQSSLLAYRAKKFTALG